jgi:folate-dependent phosphoribosylglycinamide formyltransferase PurN
LIIEKLKTNCKQKGVTNFFVFKMADGGNLNLIVLLIGLTALKDNEKIENLQEDLSTIEKSLSIRTITNITSETLAFRADMSLIQK